MALTAKIKNTTTALTGSVVLDKNRREDPDYGQITVLSTRAERYEVGDVVDITDGVLALQYIVRADTPLQLKSTYYEHSITLSETITAFNKIYPVDRSFTTVPARTIRQILAAYIRELKFYHGITVTLTDSALYDTPMPDKEYAGVNMTAIFYDVMRRIDAIPRVTWVWGTQSWTLTHELYSARGSAVTVTAYDSKQTEANDVEYATAVKSQAKNAVTDDDGIWVPSSAGWIRPRPAGYQFKTSDLQYEFDSKITSISKAVAKVPATLFIRDESLGAYVPSDVTVEVDFTLGCLPSDAYSALTENVTTQNPRIVWDATIDPAPLLWKQNAVYYNIGDTVVEGLYSVFDGVIFNTNIKALYNTIYQFVYESTKAQFATEIGANAWYVSPIIPTDTEDIECRFQYHPMRDIDFTVEKHDISGLNASAMLTSQSDSKIELGRYVANVGAIAQRIGHRVTRLSKWFDSTATYWKLGDYANIGQIVDIRYTFDKNGVTCLADFALGFSNINGEYAIAREPSPYTFTDRRVTSNYIYTQYLEFSKTPQDNITDLTATAHRILLNLLDWSTNYDVPMTVGNMTPYPLQEQFVFSRQLAVNLPLVVSGNSNAILLHSQIMHPQMAGNGMRKVEGVWYKNPVQYTDEDDGMTEFRYTLAPVYTEIADTFDRKFYPLVEIAPHTYTASVLFPADKDINAAWAMTYQIMCVTDSPSDIIIGPAFTKYNNFIMKHTTEPITKLYFSTVPYTIFDRVVRSTDYIAGNPVVTLTGTTLTVSSSSPLVYWALAYDETDEIILAGNNRTTTIYTNIKTRRDVPAYSYADAYEVGATLELSLNIFANGFMPVWYDDEAEFDLSISMTATGTLQFNYADDAELALEVSVVAYGIMFIPQREQGSGSVSLTISMTATGDKDEFSNRWVLTEDDTYDYTSASTGLTAPTEKAANYDVGEIMRKWNGIDAYRYWIIVFD